jgi:hypothetical protein
MSKVKIIAVTLVAATAFMAIAASSASAIWFVKGTALKAGQTVALANTAAVDTSTVLSAPSLGLRLTCSGSTLDGVGAYIQGEASGGAESLTFLGCSEIAPTTCKIEMEKKEIKTEPVVASVEKGTAPFVKILFSPKGKAFAAITFEGTCAFAGEQPVDGRVVASSQDGQIEQTTHALEGLGTTENNSLELFKAKAYLVGGKALLKLLSGLPWSFR